MSVVPKLHASPSSLKMSVADQIRPIAEEIKDASITLPKAIMWSVVVNVCLGFLVAITLVFTLGDVNSLFASVSRQPFIQLFFNATQSYGGTNAMTAIVIILLTACCISEVATASRQLWSFARDQGLPGSGWLSKVRQLLTDARNRLTVS